jgi:DNA-binding HxlR family transcriptional regulator
MAVELKQQLEPEVCPVELTAKLVGDKWTLLIIRDLAESCMRFSALQRSVHGISPRTLSDRLSMLESAGIITREAFAEIPPRVEYRLTEMGRGLIPVIEAMRAYGNQWLAGKELASME